MLNIVVIRCHIT